jgi:ATP-binding cassette subfamily B protein/subfamily B ATP-binding cassette protein MsbA
MRGYKRLIPYGFRQWRTLSGILMLTALSAALTALQPWPIKLVVDYALGSTPLPEILQSIFDGLSLRPLPTLIIVVAGLSVLGLYVLNSALDIGLSWGWTAAGQRMVYDLAADLFHRLQRLSLLFHSRHTVGESLSRLSGDTWCVYTATSQVLISPGKHVLTLATVGIVAWQLDPTLTILSFALVPVLAGSAFFFGQRLKTRTRMSREAESRLLAFVHQTLGAIPIIQAFGALERNGERFRHLASSAVVLSQRGVLVKTSYELVNQLVNTLGTAIVLYAGGWQVLSGALTVGSLLVFLAYLRSLQAASAGLINIYGSLKSVEANLDRIMEILDVEEGVKERPDAKPLAPRAAGAGAYVRLEGVSFGYEPGRPVLQDITLEARPGETIALVGATGAGKSTLVSLIPRFFDPWEGRVLFDGMDVREVQLASLRAQMALVLQEPFLLPLTVAENIAYGRPEASRQAIVEAAVAANADGFIRRLPQGYDTVLGERGVTLSGGERQRLAIARALLKDAPVLILDEPTSALDAQTEAWLLEALERLMAGRTTFIIAHRLSTIRRADRIVVLEQGRMVESGTHSELLHARGLYHRLYQLQFETSSWGQVA